MAMKRPFYSIILPVRDESANLARLMDEIRSGMHGKTYEIIAVDDASRDASCRVLKNLIKSNPRLQIIHMSHHSGKWAALRAGIQEAKGNVIITMDADLQDDPKELTKFISYIARGYDIVSGWRKYRHDTFYKVQLTILANVVLSRMTGRVFHDFASPMKIYRKAALEQLPQEGALLRYSMLMAHQLRLRTIEIPVSHRPRQYGTSKFGVMKYFRILYDLMLILLLFSGSGRLTQRRS